MEQIISSFIIQSDICTLPELGRFKKVVSSATTDVANQQILPPKEEIIFQERSGDLSEELIHYTALKKNITDGEAAQELMEWCHYAKEKLKSSESIMLSNVGTLKMTYSGSIYFEQADIAAPRAINAQRVIHENAEHAVLVGDKESTNTKMSEYLNNEVSEKNGWWKKAALILALLALLLLVLFYRQYDAQNKFGNRSFFTVETPGKTYMTP